MRRFSSGFTFIELSVILVIIGLVVGSILAGAHLMQQAKLRAAGAQTETYRTAVHTFRSKYNSIPGDIRDAAAFGLGTSGNGDGRVSTGEIPLFWYHLYVAQLIGDKMDGVGTPSTGIYGNPVPFTIGQDVPMAKYNDLYGYYPLLAFNGNHFNWNMNGHIFSMSNSFVLFFGYGLPSRSEAYPYDYKFDDGRPGTGNIQSVSNVGGGNGYCASTTDPLTAQYPNDDIQPHRCPLYIAGGF